MLTTAAPTRAAFPPPRIVAVAHPFDDGQSVAGEPHYYIDRGRLAGIEPGDVLSVYRERSAENGGPAVRFFLGTLRIEEAKAEVASGVFVANAAAMDSSGLTYRTAMLFDLVVPVLRIDADALFDPQTASLRPTATAQFQRAADFIGAYQPARLVIAAHTDGSTDPEAEQALSEARAAAVRLYLIETLPAVTPAMVDARGFGDRRPEVLEDTEPARARNRRLEIIVWE